MACLIGIEKPLSSQLRGRDDVSQRRLSDVLLKAEMYRSPPVGPVSWHRRKTRQILPTSSLVSCWQKHPPPPPVKRLLLQGGFTDERQVQSSKATTNLSKLNATHEEADTRMVLHCIHNNSESIVVSARDTDVLLMLVAHCDHVQSSSLWLMAGAAKIRKYFNIREISYTLSENTVPALLPYHSLTGCDTISYFFAAKQATWCKFQQHYNLLATLGEGELTDLKLHDTTDEVRTALFFEASKPEHMPPTSNALRFHLMRSHY